MPGLRRGVGMAVNVAREAYATTRHLRRSGGLLRALATLSAAWQAHPLRPGRRPARPDPGRDPPLRREPLDRPRAAEHVPERASADPDWLDVPRPARAAPGRRSSRPFLAGLHAGHGQRPPRARPRRKDRARRLWLWRARARMQPGAAPAGKSIGHSTDSPYRPTPACSRLSSWRQMV
jgi:hypothetical protein